jgi:hypothetical protein
MRSKGFAAALVAGTLASTAPAAAQPPTTPPGGCQAFGQNVAGLAQTLGGDFGGAASAAARSQPGGIVTFVVAPEQTALCPEASGANR